MTLYGATNSGTIRVNGGVLNQWGTITPVGNGTLVISGGSVNTNPPASLGNLGLFGMRSKFDHAFIAAFFQFVQFSAYGVMGSITHKC